MLCVKHNFCLLYRKPVFLLFLPFVGSGMWLSHLRNSQMKGDRCLAQLSWFQMSRLCMLICSLLLTAWNIGLWFMSSISKMSPVLIQALCMEILKYLLSTLLTIFLSLLNSCCKWQTLHGENVTIRFGLFF